MRIVRHMSTAQTFPPTSRKPLRLWPGIVLVAVQWFAWCILPVVAPGSGGYGVMGGFLIGGLVILWWLFFSRAPWLERLGALALMVLAVMAGARIVHASIAGGMMGMMPYLYFVPVYCLALVVWAAATRHLADVPRRAALVAAALLACAAPALLRTGGISGDAISDFHWRWSQTPEERLLAHAAEPVKPTPAAAPAPASASAAEASKQPLAVPSAKPAEHSAAPAAAKSPAAEPAPAARSAEWPGFRGSARDGVVRGTQIATDWTASPPVQLWRQPIGPGWSSFAVQGDLVYTQEQRGKDEEVACYSLTTGKPVWRHRDPVRFYESNAGAGPRGTPTLSNGRVYAFGATGVLNALDAHTGSVLWSRNAASDTAKKTPGWGFSASPLVVGDVVIIAAAGKLAAYDAATGKLRWTGDDGGGGYSSPHLVTMDSVPQVVLLSESGVAGFAPADGRRLWQHPLPSGARIVQPGVTAEGDLLIQDAEYAGTDIRRISVKQADGTWKVEERWTSTGLKPYFNDFVVHKGHAYGFDGNILSCIDLKDGSRKWKGGRYGSGQLVLLADQDLLLVLSEEGELALVSATPDQFKEVARRAAIEGKTWNHPVLVGGTLLVRNGEEMAAFRLAPATR